MRLLCYNGELYEALYKSPSLVEEVVQLAILNNNKKITPTDEYIRLFYLLLSPFLIGINDKNVKLTWYFVPVEIYNYFCKVFDGLSQSSSDIDETDFKNIRDIPNSLYDIKYCNFIEDGINKLSNEFNYGTRSKLYSEFKQIFLNRLLLHKLEILSEKDIIS